MTKLKVVIDCANGAASQIVPPAIRRLGVKVKAINCHLSRDQVINSNCGSEYVRLHPEKFIKIVRQERADYGLAFDGDGDRVAVVDVEGNFYNGDDFLFVLGKYFLKKGSLHKNTVVTTRMVNSGLIRAFDQLGVRVTFTHSGDRYLEKRLFDKHYHIGAEQFGNVFIYDDWHIAADPLYAFITMLSVLGETRLIDLVSDFQKVHQVKASLQLRRLNKQGYDHFLQRPVRKARKILGKGARIVYWESTTQPGLLNLMIEGNNLELVTKQVFEICAALRCAYGPEQTNIHLTNLSLRKVPGV